jgi:hypothetical protein
LDDCIYCTLYIHTVRKYRQYSAIAILHTFKFTVPHALGFSVLTSHIPATDLSQYHCNFKSHVKSSWHRLIPFLALSCSCQFRRLYSTTLDYCSILRLLCFYFYYCCISVYSAFTFTYCCISIYSASISTIVVFPSTLLLLLYTVVSPTTLLLLLLLLYCCISVYSAPTSTTVVSPSTLLLLLLLLLLLYLRLISFYYSCPAEHSSKPLCTDPTENTAICSQEFVFTDELTSN